MDIEEVRKVARLARLEIADAELAVMANQLSAILGYFELLKPLNTEGIEPLAHPLPIHNVFRPDKAGQSLSVNEALRNAPNRIGDFFGIPAVLADSQ